MMTDWRRERAIRRALRALARQRIAVILQPGNVWVIEQAPDDQDVRLVEAIRSCYLRGWADVLPEAVPQRPAWPRGGLFPAAPSSMGSLRSIA